MNPQNSLQPQDRQLHVPNRHVSSAQPGGVVQEKAADAARTQLNHIYQQAPPNQPASAEEQNPYQRTHRQNFDWGQYHSAWQQYYQQYYHRYYRQQLHSERQRLTEEATKASQPPQEEIISGEDQAGSKLSMGRTEMLKQDIVSQVKKQAQKARRSRHFIPILSALAVALVFLFLQFNSVLIAQVRAYVSPGALNNDALVVDPAQNISVGPEPRMIIPKINVDVPVDYGVQTLDEASIQTSLRDGATYYNLPGANSRPGQFGNTVILGHSGNDIFNQGQFKFVFVLLDRLNPGDVYYLHYEGKRYIYKVTEKKVIHPTEVSALQIGNDKAMSTLITCTPPGTALNRLLIFGEQISPDPAGDTPAPAPEEQNVEAQLPGTQPSVLEKVWDYFF